MIKLETPARALGKTLITLDTKTGDNAELLYAEMGYVTAGTIPGYCRDPFVEQLHATTIMYKALYKVPGVSPVRPPSNVITLPLT